MKFIWKWRKSQWTKWLVAFGTCSVALGVVFTGSIVWANTPITWPNSAPAGEAEGGTMMNYFRNAFGDATTWQSCPNGVIIGFEGDGTPRCIVNAATQQIFQQITQITQPNGTPSTTQNGTPSTTQNGTSSSTQNGTSSSTQNGTSSSTQPNPDEILLQPSSPIIDKQSSFSLYWSIGENLESCSFIQWSPGLDATNTSGWYLVPSGVAISVWSASGNIGPFVIRCINKNTKSQVDSTSVVVATKNLPIVSFSASDNTVVYNWSAILRWSTTNATSCTASNDWSESKTTGNNQSQTLTNLTSSQTYTLTCINWEWSTSKSIAVQVLDPQRPTILLSADRTDYRHFTTNGVQMVPATLSWSVTNAQKCQLKNFGKISSNEPGPGGGAYYFVDNDTQEIDLDKERNASWSRIKDGVYSDKDYGEMPTTGSRTYMITCYGLWDTMSTAELTLPPPEPVINLLQINNLYLAVISPNIQWQSNYTKYCNLSGYQNNVATTGTYTVAVGSYAVINTTLTCYNDDWSFVKSTVSWNTHY